jgi:two-component sensor histidine kinase
LLFHELATNAAKYGALSPQGGKLAIQVTTEEGILMLKWLETAPATLGNAPGRQGFGSHLEQASIRVLRGTIERAWRPEGLAVDIRLPLAQLVS